MHRSRLPALLLFVTGIVIGVVVGRRSPAPVVSEGERAAITDTIEKLIADAYDFSKPNVPERMALLYADSAVVVSAGNGRIMTSRDTISAGIRSFWERIGQNMVQPQFMWAQTYVEVLSPTAAVLTGRYDIPHHAPNGQWHEIGGAWTALFEKRYGRWVIVQEHLSDPGTPMGDMSGAATGSSGGRSAPVDAGPR